MGEVERLFQNGLSLREIERRTGINRKCISRHLKRNGFSVKARSSGTTGMRKHTLYEDIFDEINTEEKAYWLGFLYAI